MKTIILPKTSRCTLAAGIVGACALGFAAMAAANDALGAPKVSIRYGDLNLATSQGAKVLYERIIIASYAVCQSSGRDANDNANPFALEACRKKIIAEAVSKIGKPTLYALYNAKKVKPLPTPIVTADSRK
jgi:UrcA family protein